MSLEIFQGMKWVFGTEHPVLMYPSSATGAWEAAVANCLSPGDAVVAFAQGFFAGKWAEVAARFGLEVRLQPWDLRVGVTPEAVAELLTGPGGDEVKAVLVVHNETSTGVTSDVAGIGAAMREIDHPALLMVDAVSSLAAMEFRHDDWGIDVTVSGSQKGLMLPPGLAFVAVGPRALAARETAQLPVSYWRWDDHLDLNAAGFFPYTPATNLLFGLAEALEMLRDEGLQAVFARHARLAEATRTAVRAWDLERIALNDAEASNAVTAVLTPSGSDADALRAVILERFDVSLGTALGPHKGAAFRIGHLGDFNEPMLMGTLACVEMGLGLAGVPHRRGGVDAAMEYLTGSEA
jgi:alanine-glyoxylate transaminase/serine-glyoxylate transaminase/serine-pyruvate transaminase